MDKAGDIFNITFSGRFETAILHTGSVVAVENYGGTLREGFHVIAQIAVERMHAVEIIFLPDGAAGENLLFVFVDEVERSVGVQGDDKMKFRAAGVAHFFTGDAE